MGQNTQWVEVFRGNLFVVEKNERGHERVARPPGVRLLLFNAEGKLCLTEEYRAELGETDVRLPGGKVFDDVHSWLEVRTDETRLKEAVLEAGRIEAKEEVGAEVYDLEILGKSPCGATVEWDLWFLKARVASLGEQDLHGDEAIHGIKTGFYTQEEVIEIMKSGKMQEDRALTFLLKYFAFSPAKG